VIACGFQLHRPSERITRHRGLGWRQCHLIKDLRICMHALGRTWCCVPPSAASSVRLILRPAFSVVGHHISSSLIRCATGWRLVVRARRGHRHHNTGNSLPPSADQIASCGSLFDIEQAAGTGDFLPLARLDYDTSTRPVTTSAFDPSLHTTPRSSWCGMARRCSTAAYRHPPPGRGAQ